MTSREQRLITKEHIATHTNLILPFKPALYSSTYPTGNTIHVTSTSHECLIEMHVTYMQGTWCMHV